MVGLTYFRNKPKEIKTRGNCLIFFLRIFFVFSSCTLFFVVFVVIFRKRLRILLSHLHGCFESNLPYSPTLRFPLPVLSSASPIPCLLVLPFSFLLPESLLSSQNRKFAPFPFVCLIISAWMCNYISKPKKVA